MAKIVTFGKEAQEKMLIGFNTVADAVGATLGPKGLNGFIQDGMYPKITNDGATIAAHTEVHDNIENLGAGIVRNTSNQTNDDAGDGTTTTAVLLQAIVHECLKRPENPMDIRFSLKEAAKKVIQKLEKKSIKITKKDIEKVALISSENKELARMITEIIGKIGEKSIITVEDSKTFESSYEITEGYEANVGFMSPAFITDTKKARAVFENVPVFVSEKRISSVSDISTLWNQFAFKVDRDGKPLMNPQGQPTPRENPINSCVIVCDDIDDSMLGVFINSKKTGVFSCLVIRATHPLLEDIEAAVGATRVSDTTGKTFQNITLKDLGMAKKVISDSKKTLFLADSKNSAVYAKHLEKMMEQEQNMYVKQKLGERISKLRGGIAVVRVAAHSDYDREYLKYKAEDTIKAVQAALAEGVVEGGGMTLWRIAQEIKPVTVGDQILKKALTAPLRKIIENAGKDYAEIVSALGAKGGYDAFNDKIVDMMKSGIIDPTKIERCAVENSVSAAATFITSGFTITEYVKEDSE